MQKYKLLQLTEQKSSVVNAHINTHLHLLALHTHAVHLTPVRTLHCLGAACRLETPSLEVSSNCVFPDLSTLWPLSGQLCIPAAKDNEAIDAILLPSIGLQVTVAARHDIKLAGAYLAAQVCMSLFLYSRIDEEWMLKLLPMRSA